MSHYPIFTQLNGRAVLVVGGGEVAARKVEALLHAGARVFVVAKALNARFLAWQQSGEIEWLSPSFKAAYLAQKFLVIAASSDRALNQQVFAAAEAAAVWCNTVDEADLCSFIVPAVIDRVPFQVALSTGGHAPVLARLWQRKIEQLLPRHLGRLTLWAGQWRARVKDTLTTIGERRRFWERLLADPKLDTAAAGNQAQLAEGLFAQHLSHTAPSVGEVALVGAGPGDAGLLTLHAQQALHEADVVFYDALVSAEILALVRKDASKIAVGKRAGRHSVAQEETNWLLVQAAQEGKRVVRLKGGDPFVFGRGGEEAQVLAAAGIAYRIIPGITAGLGATAYAGIPLTHRDFAQTVVFITGHCRTDGDELQWDSLARGKQTLVIYMGTIKASEISRELMAHGRGADTPVAIVSQGTLKQQTVQTGYLKDLPQLALNAPRPALIIIGEVVALREELAWFAAESAERLAPLGLCA